VERIRALLQAFSLAWFWFAGALVCIAMSVLFSWTVSVPAKVINVMACTYRLGKYQTAPGSQALVQTGKCPQESGKSALKDGNVTRRLEIARSIARESPRSLMGNQARRANPARRVNPATRSTPVMRARRRTPAMQASKVMQARRAPEPAQAGVGTLRQTLVCCASGQPSVWLRWTSCSPVLRDPRLADRATPLMTHLVV
jgi:hypothetical protein